MNWPKLTHNNPNLDPVNIYMQNSVKIHWFRNEILTLMMKAMNWGKLTHNNLKLDFVNINLVKINQFVLKILSWNEILTLITCHNSAMNWRKLTTNKPNLIKGYNFVMNWPKFMHINSNLDPININAYVYSIKIHWLFLKILSQN